MKNAIFPAIALLGILAYSQPAFPSGEFKTTFYKSGQVECQTPYKNGKKEGTQTCFYETGVKKTESVYSDNTERLFIWYAPDGLPLMSLEYDARHSLTQSKTWYASGELKNITPYRNGVRHGLFREYHKNGTVKSEILYDNDAPVP